MTSRLQWLALLGSGGFLVVVLELVRRRRLAEEYSALWIVAALCLLGASLRRDLMDRAALWLGIAYGPAVLLLALVVVGASALLWMSVVLSRQQSRIDWLIEETAILAAELRAVRSGSVEQEIGDAQRGDATAPIRGAVSQALEGGGAEAPDYIVGGAPKRRLHLAKR